MAENSSTEERTLTTDGSKTDLADAICATRRSYRELVDGTLRVTFDVDPTFKKDFLTLFPDIDMPAAIAPLLPETYVPHETPDYGQFYKNLYQSRFLLEIEVLQELGQDDMYRAWIQHQNCIVCQKQDFIQELGEGRCEAAHVRRAATFGTAYKADFACVPLCYHHHGLQHLKGESMIGGVGFVEKQRDKLLREWAWQQLRDVFHVESMTQIDPVTLVSWAQSHNLESYLP